ncbi:MAG: topoisomerase C-terminal repeat-containing protein, partial [Gammaproteobacteria bacterium]
PGQKLATITYEEAMELFKLPRKLGETPEGEKVSASIGRFGPYVRYGDKFVSISPRKGRDGAPDTPGADPYTIELEEALEFVKQKKIDDANKLIQDFPDEGIQILNGRYGPYVTNKEKNARVPKDRKPESLTLEECIEMLEKAPMRRGKKKKKKKVTKKAAKKKVTKKKTKKKSKKKAKKKTKKKAKKKASKKVAAKAAGDETAAKSDGPVSDTDT